MMAAIAFSGERRRYWLSLAALIIILPSAILIHSGGNLLEWWRQSTHEPIVVERGAAQNFAGANWRLTALTRLPGGIPGTAVILAEFEATVDDPAQLQSVGICEVGLVDNQDRRWEPLFLTEQVVRRTKPEAADKPRCGSFENTDRNTVRMAESFVVPEDAKELSLSATFQGTLPKYLLFR
ncbi:hypothetical protein ABFT80_20360 [Mesorhizobium sp. SB112]|uniref:hypothetical protein n=1 Tax=Mesorhizobium sp. SB112 TaxID=3151853 RepID=UPI0032671970